MRYLLLLLFTIMCIHVNPCTTFLLSHNGQHVFGRNYDWMADAGLVCTNQRGLVKISMKTSSSNTILWISKYGSITFNQYGKEFPTGGMNEKGLVVELMWLDDTRYPPDADPRPALSVLQWIQYQLDNCSTIEEVIASDKLIRVSTRGTPLHYLIADANGNAATIEYLDGKMKVHKGEQLPFPVLTNDTYDNSIKSRKNRTYTGNNSLERFNTACEMITQYKANPNNKSMVDQSFDILSNVAQGDFTKWSIVYDISNKKIWFKTNEYNQRRWLTFDEFDFSCNKPSKMIDINRPENGEIGGLMMEFDPRLNTDILEKTLIQSRSKIRLSEAEKQGLMGYPTTIHCE